MSQKQALANVLVLFGPIAVAFLTLVFMTLFRQVDLPSLLVLSISIIGFIHFLRSKWELIGKKKFFTFGPKDMTTKSKVLYWRGYILMVTGLALQVYFQAQGGR
jgi:hypothetical protein